MNDRNHSNHHNAWRKQGCTTAVAAAIAVMGWMGSLEAHALALGRISVLSALGEPLRAEIEIADINAEEAATLKAGIARAEIFKASGLEYTAVAANVNVSLQRRANGRSYFRLTSTGPVNEPFVDLVLEATWATGRITRDYTMLLDPPVFRPSGSLNAPLGLQTAPQLPPGLPVQPPQQAPIRPQLTPRPAAATPAPAPMAAAAQPSPSARDAGALSQQQVTIQTGDTAGKIASRNKPASVSLDQMLVALLRSNPDAFIGGNVNRMRAGSVVELPSAEAASAISPSEARQTIVAQSQDFNAFRRKLAESAPAIASTTADRQVAGKVQARVEDRTPAASTPDKLTLSQGVVQAGKSAAAGAAPATAASAAEDKIAKEREARDAATRVAELSKNISDLNRLSAASAPAASASAAAAAASAARAPTAVPSIAVPAPAGLPATAATPGAATLGPATVAASAASAPVAPAAAAAAENAASAAAVASAATAAAAAASAALDAASAPTGLATPALPGASAAMDAAPAPGAAISTPAVVVAPPARPPAPQTAPAVAESSLIDDFLSSPYILPLLGLLLALLAGFGLYRYRRRQAAEQEDNAGVDSRLQADSFFGASGGQRIDTNEGTATGSSLVYSPSQLDAAGDVDPVAEADVYLAYGRDLQAEEILKEALRTTPTRAAIHAKLLEIYAKRRDVKAFESLATEAYNLTQGQGPEWAYITEMGRELDPANLTYQSGGRPAGARNTATALAAVSAAGATSKGPVSKSSATSPAWTGQSSLQAQTVPAPLQARPPNPAGVVDSASDLDLDLDFTLDDVPPPAPPPAPVRSPVAPAAQAPAAAPAELPALDMGMDMDFGSSNAAFTLPSATAAAPANSRAPAPAPASDGNDIDFFAKGLDFTPEPLPAPAAAPPAAAAAKAGKSPAPADNNASMDMMAFDMDALSLDLDTSAKMPLADESRPDLSGAEDPLETKFLLAEEFRSLGDDDTARMFAQEVLDSNPSTPLRIKTQAFLNAL